MRIRYAFFHPFIAVLLAVATLALFSLGLLFLRGALSTSVVALLYLVPVLISAAAWGTLGGIPASVLAFLAFNYFFIPPYYTFRVAHPQDFLILIVFLGVSILTSSAMASLQANVQQAQAREREAVLAAKFSQELTNQKEAGAIARVLAENLVELFPDAIAAVEILRPEGNFRLQLPDEAAADKKDAARQIALVSLRGPLGEVWIWNKAEPFAPEEERLLQTFLSQTALALDRSFLTTSETRARILEESDRLKTAILSSVSHELRTPLATIQAAATSLFNLEVELEPDAREELQSLLLEETTQMTQLVENLLNMSRLEAGALKLQREWNSLAEIVDNSMNWLRRFSGNHKIELTVSEDLPLVSVDSVLVGQVVINLVRNSLKFSPPGSTICICAVEQDTWLDVCIANQGPNIPEEYLDRIFEKFYPIPGHETVQSTGLGLSICKGIVEAHEGKIWAENLLEGGVAFHFTLPLTFGGERPAVLDDEGDGS